ncbi:hypothetical protein PTSG_06494 [Salpingoeca rosetta]|uniref:Uncharacterized protein n=1 Tax=Salpingoeca rosetta (strain ATCC 50818 / BSB-021) TaxID=946362 RepID=F2UFZ0_SALR5|nr:uncharacterized protein PTSG_06494 [Salpingoeca rosetta]EGD75418.1 hypothetical protein PTSG_06494 [Salpingoeca rosetta]|eukprot:XP_004991875.1 hypothetical protein PTSG_06494 [Salpingoeca rosetta]
MGTHEEDPRELAKKLVMLSESPGRATRSSTPDDQQQGGDRASASSNENNDTATAAAAATTGATAHHTARSGRRRTPTRKAATAPSSRADSAKASPSPSPQNARKRAKRTPQATHPQQPPPTTTAALSTPTAAEYIQSQMTNIQDASVPATPAMSTGATAATPSSSSAASTAASVLATPTRSRRSRSSKSGQQSPSTHQARRGKSKGVKGAHVMTIFERDINLLAIDKDTSLYSACRAWMAVDTTGDKLRASVKQPQTPATFSFPAPDTSAPIDYGLHVRPELQKAMANVDACLETALTGDETEEAISERKQTLQIKWRKMRRTTNERVVGSYAQRYRDSLRVIARDIKSSNR